MSSRESGEGRDSVPHGVEAPMQRLALELQELRNRVTALEQEVRALRQLVQQKAA